MGKKLVNKVIAYSIHQGYDLVENTAANLVRKMASNKQIAENAIQISLKELSLGRKQAARSWAQRAVALDPRLEEAWLILAAISEPGAGLEYVKEALRINPGSTRARQGLLDIQRRLERVSQLPSGQISHPQVSRIRPLHGMAGKAPLPQTPAPTASKKNASSRLKWLGLYAFFGLAMLSIVALTIIASQNGTVKASEEPTREQKIIILQSMATFTPTITETPSPTNTPTITPSPTDTPPPTPTDTPSPTPSLAPTMTSTPVVYTPPQPVAAAASNSNKRIVVYLSQQHLYAYQGNTLVYSFVVSTGASNSTRVGTFSILDKIPRAWSDPWGFWMPDWMGIYWVGYTENGIHALPVLTNGTVIWGDGLGTPISHGCVVLSTQDARLLFNWADIGTRVQILR